MNVGLYLKKTIRYISCAIKYLAAEAAAPFVKNCPKYKDLWLISERGTDARDNGYYLFKYITKAHPEINAAYVIDKKSPDRERVLSLGRVINHASFEHFISVVTAKLKISTHIMGYTPYIDFFVRLDKRGLVDGKKVFLQHGITKDNLKYLYAEHVNLDLFVCSAKPEFDYINELYGYKDGIVKLLGMCRYDDLYKITSPSKKILVMPTWRFNLGGADKKTFEDSEYFKTFNSLLHSERLNEILKKYNMELLFYPHIEMQRFISSFTGGERVKILSFKDSTVQELLINSDVLITDFSSVFFDYAYMEKPMIFYQFDEVSFRKEHYKEGYFDYRRDAFGEVVTDEKSLLDELSRILENNAAMDGKYEDRVKSFFTLRDKNNCERNFNAIKELCGE